MHLDLLAFSPAAYNLNWLTLTTAMTDYGHRYLDVNDDNESFDWIRPRRYFDFIMRLSDVISVKCTMLPLIFMRLSDVKENKKI